MVYQRSISLNTPRNDPPQVVKESGKPFIVGYRITPEEAHENGLTMADTIRNVDLLADQGLDYIHVSLHNFWSKPRRGTDDTRSRIEIIRDVVGDRAYVIGVGEIKTPDDAARALSSGADLLAIARGLLLDPRWVQKAQDGQEASIKTQLCVFISMIVLMTMIAFAKSFVLKWTQYDGDDKGKTN